MAAEAAGVNGTVMTLSDDVATHTVATYLAGGSTIAELEGTVATALGSTLTADFGSNHVLIAVDDGTDTIIARYSDGGTNGAVVAEISLLGFLKGVDDATDLVAANFEFA